MINQIFLLFIYNLMFERQFTRVCVISRCSIANPYLFKQFLLEILIFIKIKPEVVLEFKVFLSVQWGHVLWVIQNSIIILITDRKSLYRQFIRDKYLLALLQIQDKELFGEFKL